MQKEIFEALVQKLIKGKMDHEDYLKLRFDWGIRQEERLWVTVVQESKSKWIKPLIAKATEILDYLVEGNLIDPEDIMYRMIDVAGCDNGYPFAIEMGLCEIVVDAICENVDSYLANTNKALYDDYLALNEDWRWAYIFQAVTTIYVVENAIISDLLSRVI